MNKKPYLATISIPIAQTGQDHTNCTHRAQRYLVGEYPDQKTALDHAHQAAVLHQAECYSVVFPCCEGYDAVKARLESQPLASRQ